MISFDKTVCSDLKAASSREWLETNGIGGFAASTICGTNRRRYHALLVAATTPPVGRIVLLSSLVETLVIGEQRFALSTNAYSGAIHPEGYRTLIAFRLDPFPVFTYLIEGVEIEKSFFMVDGSNTTVVQYRVIRAISDKSIGVEVRPLVAFREYHSLTHANDAINKEVIKTDRLVSYSAYPGLPTLHLAHEADSVQTNGFWYYNFQYEFERERGLDYTEDLFSPLAFNFTLKRSQPASIIASTETVDIASVETLRKAEIRHRTKIISRSLSEDPFVIALTSAADQLLVRRGSDWTIMAGYPWFTDWGRDTMISLPGLTLHTGRPDVARSILLSFSRFVDQGMLPNCFPDTSGKAAFNTVDAALWYFEAVRSYVEFTGDLQLARDLYPTLSSIIDWHIKGTRYGIKLLENGLLNAGEPGVQLTWMDAKIGDWVVTPRNGAAVEIQALWFNALKIMEDFAQRFNNPDDHERCRKISTLLKDTFNRVFWNEKENCLFDVVNGDATDASIRPNQIFAVSLRHPLVEGERARSIVNVVERELLTPYGLRTLSPRDPKYRGQYAGDVVSRDSAYHQGTVWPWLLGPFFSAYLKVYGKSATIQEKLRNWLEPLRRHLGEAGLGQISEVFDGDPPHRPGGCFAQAWSVAEVLRTLCEDVHSIRPDR